MHKSASVAEQWANVLREGGYEPPVVSPRKLARLTRYSRIWKRLHRLINIKKGDTFFEFGCGGGQHLIPLALHGHHVAGIDFSHDVLDRCQRYINQVEEVAGRRLPITLFHGDFLEYETTQRYDVVFNFGVVEHFLNDAERLAAIRKMAELTRPGGHIFSVVPNGIHPFRARQRAEKLGGYDVPEIDYDEQVATAEILKVGAINPVVFPANLFGYLTMKPTRNRVSSLANRTAFYAAQLIPPVRSRLTFKHAGSLIITGKSIAAEAKRVGASN
jgi:SAM-dependent methyltransferase